jgi:hypothetical protein
MRARPAAVLAPMGEHDAQGVSEEPCVFSRLVEIDEYAKRH